MAETFEEISPADHMTLYDEGYSINEIAKIMHCSYTCARNILLKNGVKLRTKREAFAALMSRHPEWREQFSARVCHKIPFRSHRLSQQKIKLLILILTEGYICENKVQFTNNHTLLLDRFSTFIKRVYKVNVRRGGNVAYVFSKELTDDLNAYNIKEKIPDEVMHEILKSRSFTKEVLRLFADTEGAVIISIRKAINNYTVGDRRIVIASTNDIVKKQLLILFKSLGIKAHEGKVGVLITDELSLRSFALQVGFSLGMRVIRKKGDHGVWYGYEKATLLRLLVWICNEQIKRGRGYGRHEGVFRNCKTAEEVFKILRLWYNELRGEGA